ncbi:hypothetical protein B0H13DRAFT_1908157 [Mycena leptocephala]|nr:hypothetical protein B0H13DRAFT_1908157 [Mycena leptocephala]
MVLILLPRETRKRPVFYLSIASLILGIIEGFMLAHLYAQAILAPARSYKAYTAVLNLLLLFSTCWGHPPAENSMYQARFYTAGNTHKFRARKKAINRKASSFTVCSTTQLSVHAPVAQQMQIAWRISMSNFVIPCTLQAIQVIVVLLGRSKGQSELQWFYECSFLMIINGYITILGVIFATVWAEATNWAIQEGASWARIPMTVG